MRGVAELADAEIRAAAEGAPEARSVNMRGLESRIRLMVAARLSLTPAQFSEIDDIAQEVLAALTQKLPQLVHRRVADLSAFDSGIVARAVALGIRRPGVGKDGGPRLASLDSTIAAMFSGAPLW
jgi:DNA-directed RNA polymerase specialized sigma24 family protein